MFEIELDFLAKGRSLSLWSHATKHATISINGISTDVAFAARSLPIAPNCLDSIYAHRWLSRADDVLMMIERLTNLLRAGGELVIMDSLLPNEVLDTRYVRAFHQLRNVNEPLGYSEYDWRGFVLDAGLRLKAVNPPIYNGSVCTPLHLPLLDATQNYTPQQIECLQVMLLRAPDSVAKWLSPEYAGTEYATFQQQSITIVAQKDE